jgi:tRNA(Ile)-lysidine synthase
MVERRFRFSGESLLDRLGRLPPPGAYWVGFSGGADSTALLQAMWELRERIDAPLRAVHFDHGLQQDSKDWQARCRAFCEERDIPYHSQRLDVRSGSRRSLEEEARNCRYRAVAELLGESEMYLTAHHAEDQAETLFLNLMRGSGIEGLAGIPVVRRLARGWVARPLLDVHRAELESFLEDRQVEWLEDPSNTDLAFDRNFLRHELFPLLEERWPGVSRRLARTARNARVGASALARFIEDRAGQWLRDPLRLPLDKLLDFDEGMQTLVLRQWLRQHEVPALPEARMGEFLQQIASSDHDSQPAVRWDDWSIRRYRNALWLHHGLPLSGCAKKHWTDGMAIDLGTDSGRYVLHGCETAIPPGWRVAPREKGMRLRPHAQGHSRKIKHYFQSGGVPPWLRLGIPLLYWDDEPVALGDWVLGHRLQDWLSGNALTLEWQPVDPALRFVRDRCKQQEWT